MSRRIDVELTSARDDGTWTWRAAGAREPKGTLESSLLYEGAKVGDVVRAEADFDIDGITILTILPPKKKEESGPARIEILGPQREFKPVTSTWTPKSERPRPERRDRPDRPDRPPRGGDRPPRTEQQRGPRPERGSRPERADRPPRAERPPRPERQARPEPPARPRPKRLNPQNKHGQAELEALSPEQRPIAEQLLRGGIPAVRKAIEEQNAQLKEQGQPEINGGPLLSLAEQLLPRMKGAEWRDRAEAALADVDEIGLRDLRSVVTSSDAAARDDESRKLATQLREALDRRLKEQQESWVAEITSALEEGRLVRALRVSSRPPEPSMRVSAELAGRLASSASESLSPDTAPDRWAALLEAVAISPVRRTVKPAGLPAEPGESLLQACKQQVGRVPALAPLIGISMPPPPAPVRPGGAGGGPGRRPPRPPRPSRPAPTVAAPAPAPEASPATVPTEAASEPAPPEEQIVPEAAVTSEPEAEPEVEPTPVVADSSLPADDDEPAASE
jgi:hypothetical protein